MRGRSVKPEPAIATYAIIARSGEKVRLRRMGGADLDLAIGDALFVDAVYADGGETVLGFVIGRPAAGIVEVETRGNLDGKPREVTIRRTRLVGRGAA